MTALQIAAVCHEANRAYCVTIGDSSQPPWDAAPDWQRKSAVLGVEAHIARPDMTAEDSHISWLATKVADGWTYGPVKDAVRKQHPCCVPYGVLPAEQRAKDALFSSIVGALRHLVD